MSTINVTNLKGRGGASPNFPDGANVTGVVTATSFVGSGQGLTGVASTDYIITGTAATFNNTVNANASLNVALLTTTGITTLGNLVISKSAAGAGATVGSATGVTTYYGDGSGLTGVGSSIAPWDYNPDVNDRETGTGPGIGITFNTKVVAGSGTATLKIVSAGVAGTTIQSWGVSSCTYSSTVLTFGALVSDLQSNAVYQIDIPEGFIVDSGAKSYTGTAYTFATTEQSGLLHGWGDNDQGQVGDITVVLRSSPVQIPSKNWIQISADTHYSADHSGGLKANGTLWAWGKNQYGQLGQGSANGSISSPVQIPGNWSAFACGVYSMAAVNTDGELFTWGYNSSGQLGQNDGSSAHRSSPVQVPGTTWAKTFGTSIVGGYANFASLKTDGTYWIWGSGNAGHLGQNQTIDYSSPVQVPGTDWAFLSIDVHKSLGIKTNGQLWTWGKNQHGQLGMNMAASAYRSSPIQVPGSWGTAAFGDDHGAAVNTDGELFCFGNNSQGNLAQNNTIDRSSPIQVGSDTTWGKTAGTLDCGANTVLSVKTDGTLWGWGKGDDGVLQTASNSNRSSPVQLSSGVSDISSVVVGSAIHSMSGTS